MSLLFEAAMLCDDDTRLQSVVPYMITQIKDPSSSVRSVWRMLLIHAHNDIKGLHHLYSCHDLMQASYIALGA